MIPTQKNVDGTVGMSSFTDDSACFCALAVCAREFDRLADDIAKRVLNLQDEEKGLKCDVRRSPGRCIVQLGPVALTISWLRTRAAGAGSWTDEGLTGWVARTKTPEFIRDQRVERCRRDLADPALRGRPVPGQAPLAIDAGDEAVDEDRRVHEAVVRHDPRGRNVGEDPRAVRVADQRRAADL